MSELRDRGKAAFLAVATNSDFNSIEEMTEIISLSLLVMVAAKALTNVIKTHVRL